MRRNWRGPEFQSTLPVWGGTVAGFGGDYLLDISIHPPRVGRDIRGMRNPMNSWISIHPPRVGRDCCGWASSRKPTVFQSTLPVWGGTFPAMVGYAACYISIHPPRVGRDMPREALETVSNISIHPPRVGRDIWVNQYLTFPQNFNPPSPCGEGQRISALP